MSAAPPDPGPHDEPRDVRSTVRAVAGRLAAAGVASPDVDASMLVGHVLGVPWMTVPLQPALDAANRAALDALVARRAAREPLQHLLGTAVLGPVTVGVGPGVFVPRPETEVLLEWATRRLAGRDRPVVVDLCSGSGALALAVAASCPAARVHAVEADPDALVWARRNAAGSRVTVHDADVTHPGVLADLAGGVDVVVANPPYVPDGTTVPPEVHHDPARAVFGGPDGLAVVRPLATLAARLVRPGGAVGVEHDETHGPAVREILRVAGFVEVTALDDLAGRPRVAVGDRLPGALPIG